MQPTPKIITIIGLVLEGIGVLSLGLFAILIRFVENIPGYDSMLNDMSVEDLEIFEWMMGFLNTFLLVMVIILIPIFIINLILFTKLINGSFNEKQAKKVYLYQAIWGGLNIISNTVTGILYLISGVQGYNGRVDRINTREGI
jgi:hypothetical protein